MDNRMKYDYGTDVVFATQDEDGNSVSKPGTVVGITTVETEEQSRAFERPLGTTLYTVELGDGSDMLLAEEQLEPLPNP